MPTLALGRTITAPTDLPGCVLWLDASDVSSMTMDGSNNVSQWNDKSGAGNHGTQATASQRPVYTPNYAGGRAGLVAISANNTLLSLNGTTGVVLSGACSIFIVCTQSSVVGKYIFSDSVNGEALISAFAGKAFEWYGTATERYTMAVTAPAGWHLFSSIKNTLRVLLRYNGNAIISPATVVAVSSLKSIFNVPTGGGAMSGGIAEMIIFNRALSDGETLRVERYLAQKNNLVDNYEASGTGNRFTSPLSLSGLLFYARADVGVTLEGGTQKVAQWDDQSGQGNHVTQATSGNRPLVKANAQNGRVGINFDSTGTQFLSRANCNLVGAGPYSAFILAKTSSVNRILFGNLNAGVTAGFYAKVLTSGFRDVETPGVASHPGTVVASLNLPEIWIITQPNASPPVLYANGLADPLSAGGGIGDPGASATLGIGGGVSASMIGDIYEIGILNRVITQQERQQLEHYLAAAWGIGLVQ